MYLTHLIIITFDLILFNVLIIKSIKKMKKIILSMAVVAFLFSMNVNAQEKKVAKAKTEKSCSATEKKSCNKAKMACCASKKTEEKK